MQRLGGKHKNVNSCVVVREKKRFLSIFEGESYYPLMSFQFAGWKEYN